MKKNRRGGLLLAKTHQLSGRIFSRILRKNGISEINPAQGRILFVLWNHDGIPMNELSERTQLEKSTLTAMIDRLEKEGFLKRTASTEDRRKIFIKRTEKDRSFQKAYNKVSREMSSIFYKGFSEKEIDSFEGYFDRVLENLINYKM